MFQFHKGSINTINFSNISGLINSFNSIKVRLIRKDELDMQTVCQFQFHKGSINTRACHAPESEWRQFQFHKGSINTRAYHPRCSCR